jgi:hypothetical protein
LDCCIAQYGMILVLTKSRNEIKLDRLFEKFYTGSAATRTGGLGMAA